MSSATDNHRGKSLTPAHRAEEVAQKSFQDGVISGLLAFIPSGAAVWYGVNFSPRFRQATNYSARTAMVIMPPLFMFALTGEHKVIHQMKSMAGEDEHHSQVSEWADRQLEDQEGRRKREQNAELAREVTKYKPLTEEERDQKLSELYSKSVGGSGVRIVPGEKLGPHHVIANYWQENPFKILAAVGLPAVGYIFHQRNKKAHLDLQQQLMQTRVVGQFTVLIFLLSLMGFKEYMDQKGTFITEMEAERRVREMRAAKKELQYRLAEDSEIMKQTRKLVEKAEKNGKK